MLVVLCLDISVDVGAAWRLFDHLLVMDFEDF